VEPPLPEAAAVLGLIEACWRERPIDRPTMAEIGCRLREVIEMIKERKRGAAVAAAAGPPRR
jgi:hypothetical protein